MLYDFSSNFHVSRLVIKLWQHIVLSLIKTIWRFYRDFSRNIGIRKKVVCITGTFPFVSLIEHLGPKLKNVKRKVVSRSYKKHTRKCVETFIISQSNLQNRKFSIPIGLEVYNLNYFLYITISSRKCFINAYKCNSCT